MRDFNMSGVVVGFPNQSIHEESEAQQYPVGMIHERHGRRWRYFQAVEAVGGDHRACPNMSIVPGDTGGSVYGIEKNFYSSVPRGATKVEVENPGSTAFPVDYFVDGTMVVFSTSKNPAIFCCRISGNDLFTTTSGWIYLDEPIPMALTVEGTDWGTGGWGVNLHPSPYRNVGSAANGSLTLRTFVVVPAMSVQATYWAWGQTKGPCWVTPNAYGSGRIKVFHSNGTITDRADGSISQIAGNAIAADYDGAYGDGLIDLDIDAF